ANDEIWPNLIIRKLLENRNFEVGFINRIADHLNTVFLPDRVTHVIDSLKTLIEPEIGQHYDRWGSPDRDTWEQAIQSMKSFAVDRPNHLRNHIRRHFETGSEIRLTVDSTDPAHGMVKVNSIHINEKSGGPERFVVPWSGTYFSGVPVTMEAVPEPGYRFSHWSGSEVSENPIISITPNGNLILKAHFVSVDGAD
ncbi:MAG: CotH kinase family protein, partial [Rhodothermaceae bacterium]|nr:CotH kinase family protein [Rhodothermaceae bacterium]